MVPRVFINEFDFCKYEIKNLAPPFLRLRGKKRMIYKNCVCAFDIETTAIRNIEQSVMYVWQFQLDETITIFGRTWDEFARLLQYLNGYCQYGEGFVVYVHNLSYEFQFLSGVFDFDSDEVFCVDSREILRARLGCVEFRDSYLHSNMSLAKFCEAMKVDNKKLSGEEFGYSIQRYYFTPLTENELDYCQNDVLGLVQSIKKEMELDGDNLYTIPLTSTGYVRRDFKEIVDADLVTKIMPDIKIYKRLREAFRGGNVHANRFYAGHILEDVYSCDRSSSYPETQVNLEYPLTPFREVENASFERALDLMKNKHRALLLVCVFTNIRLREYEWGCPYIPLDKCRNVKGECIDNGRILSAEQIEITITDIDLGIILDEYIWDEQELLECYYSKYAPLPIEMRKLICNYYDKKTALKDVEGQEYFYMKSKNKINAIYGMTAQDPMKDNTLYENGNYRKEEAAPWKLEKAFLPYQWGVWCTAHARNELEKAIRAAHEQAIFIYTDTDSVKTIGKIDMTEYNKEKEELASVNGGVAYDKKGNAHYLGAYEDEGKVDKFITWGAKKYATEKDGKIKITIAGVPKIKGAQELERAGGIEQLKPPFTFYAGKLAAVYNDEVDKIIMIDNKPVHITKNVYLKDTSYVLSISDEYSVILHDVSNYQKAMERLQKDMLSLENFNKK